MAMSRDQLHNGGTWLYRAIIIAMFLAMFQRQERTADLVISHDTEIKSIQKNYDLLLAEVIKIRDYQYAINAKLEQKTIH